MSNLVAQFKSSLRSGVAPLSVNFTNFSTGPYTSVMWDFGDGSVSYEINPSHQYLNDGIYHVVLTILDGSSGANQTRTTISVFPDQSTSTSSTTQQALFTTKRFEPGQIQVKRTVLNSSTFNTLVPLSTSKFGTNTNGIFHLGLTLSSLSGGTRVAYTTGTTITSGYFHVNHSAMETVVGTPGEDWIGYLYILSMPSGGTATGTSLAAYKLDTVFPHTGTSMNQVTKYKIVGYNYTTNELTLDRPAPNLGSDSTTMLNVAYAMVSLNSGETGANKFYQNSDSPFLTGYTSSHFRQSLDLFNNLDTNGLDSPSGLTKGTNNYLGLDSNSGASYGVHYIYGPAWETMQRYSPGTIRWYIPSVMWHASDTAGLVLSDYYGSDMVDEISGLKFRYLRDSSSEQGNIVGKVFHDKKICVITDQEINAAMQYTSNRSYTLPKPIVSVNSTLAGGSDSGITYWVTYRVREDGTPSTGGTSFGLVNLTPLHCRYIQKITTENDTSQLRIRADASRYYTSDPIAGTGFTVGYVDVIVGTGVTSADYPNENSFKYSAMTTSYAALQSGLVIPNYSSMTEAYSLSSTTLSGSSNFSYGHEEISMSYISGYQESTIYKLAATCVARNNEFNTTQNPTYDETENDSVYITEVALYNENNELLMTGKLNSPIEKNDTKYVTIKMELDL